MEDNKINISINKKTLIAALIVLIICAIIGAYFGAKSYVDAQKDVALNDGYTRGYNQALVKIVLSIKETGKASYIVPGTNVTVVLGLISAT